MSALFYYSPGFLDYTLGGHHPLKPIRYKRTFDLLSSYGVFGPETPVVEPKPADIELVRKAHTDDYLEAIQQLSVSPNDFRGAYYGLGPGDTPAFKGMWEASLLYTGASLQGAEYVLGLNELQVPGSKFREENADNPNSELGTRNSEPKRRRAHNIAGGLHHAMANRASGFCILNDAAVAIHRMLETVDNVGYIDIDAHHGDGVESLFYDDPRVLTISMHESGKWLFPRTGFPAETGSGEAKGTAINIPLAPYTGDDIFLWAFHEIVPRAIETFRPDALVTQFGADAHFGDPLAHLALTTRSYEEMLSYYNTLNLPWLALGGGGYNIDTVPRVWSLVYAALAGIELRDELPQSYIAEYGGDRLRDPGPPVDAVVQAEEFRSEDYARTAVASLKHELGWN
jgi:acetoin utilization protein AcuC